MSDPILTATAALLAEHPERALPGDGWPCVEFDDRIVEAATGEDVANARARLYAGETDPWASVAAYYEAGVAESWGQGTPPGWLLIPGRWHVCQAAKRLNADGTIPTDGRSWGHHWLWYAISETHGIALESSVERGVRLGGVPLDEDTARVCAIDWPASPTPFAAWADRIAPYAAGVAVAVLRPVVDAERDALAREALRSVTVDGFVSGETPMGWVQRHLALDDSAHHIPPHDVALRMPRGPVERRAGRIRLRYTPPPADITEEEPVPDQALQLVLTILTAIRDGSVDPDEWEEIADEALDLIGPDATPVGALRAVVALLEEAARKDPARMRERAAKVEERNPERAARIRARADRVEARRAG